MIDSLTKTCVLVGMIGTAVGVYHKWDNAPIVSAMQDTQTEAVISRLNRLCQWDDLPPELLETREQLKTKYHKLTGREFSGC